MASPCWLAYVPGQEPGCHSVPQEVPATFAVEPFGAGVPKCPRAKGGLSGVGDVGGAVGVGVVNALWYWYISKSRRVARTYNLPDAALRPASMAPRPAHRGGVEMVASSSTKEPLAAPLEAYRGVTVPTVSTRLEPSSVEEKISQHRLERSLGSSLDEDLYSRCLAECEFDHLRAAAMYQRLKAGLGHSNR